MLGSALAELQADPVAAEAGAEAFQRLKPICAQLMPLRNDPHRLTAALRALEDATQSVPAAGLRRCYDYVTYPLLFMLDAAGAMRASAAAASSSGKAGGTSSSSTISDKGAKALMSVPAMQQAAAVEALLQCVLVLLQRCKGLEADQLLPLMQQVGTLLQLPRASVSEEMCSKCFQIIQAALQSQQHTPHEQQLLQTPTGRMLAGFLISTCLAAAEAEVAVGPIGSKAVRQAAVQTLGAVVTALGSGPQLAFALPGLASGLAKQLLASAPSSAGVSVTGAAAGSTGTVLVLKTLATVIQLTLGDSAISHIPGDATAQQQQPQQGGASSSSSGGAISSTADALQMLQQLSKQASGAADISKQIAPADSSTTNSIVAVAQPRLFQLQQEPTATQDTVSPLSINQDAAWLTNSSSKVHTLLAMTLPRLLTHSQPSVRQALAEVTAGLLQNCSRALSNSRVALTEILLTLANDDYRKVSQPAVRWLQSAGEIASTAAAAAAAGRDSTPGGSDASGSAPAAATGGAGGGTTIQLSDVAARLRRAAAGASPGTAAAAAAGAVGTENISAGPGSPAAGAAGVGQAVPVQPSRTAPVLADLLVELCLQLPASVRQSESVGIAAAKRTAAAVLCAGSTLVSSTVFSKAAVLQQVCSALVDTFEMDPTGAALLLRADTAVLGELPADSNYPAAAAAAAAAAGIAGAPGTGIATAATAAGGAQGTRVGGVRPSGSVGGYPLLPRMPLSLQYLISRESHKAAAAVARALGRVARLADLQQAPGGGGSSSNLQALVQQLLGQLQAASLPHKVPGSSSSSGNQVIRAGPTPAAGEWQCSAAAVVAVLSEVLFGASGAWEPPLGAAPATNGVAQASGTRQQQQQQQDLAVVDAGYEVVLLQVVTAVVKPKLWALPTAQPVGGSGEAGAEGRKQDKLPAQVLGANALLLRSLIDCVGTAARCAGPVFSTGSSRLLRTSLLPLLERLADPCPLVSTAAAGALDSICRHTGYPMGLSQLVGANADYVVDGVCRQLRSLQQHPRAPQLLAALLREAGVSAALMPLLAEPLRAALSGLSILARQQQPGYILPFLYVLQSVAAGADQEAAASRGVFRQQLQAAIADATAAGLLNPDIVIDSVSDSDDESESESDSRVREGGPGEIGGAAAKYFKQRLQQQGQEDPAAKHTTASQIKQQQQQQQQMGANGHQQPPAAAGAAEGPGTTPDPSAPLGEVPVLPTAKKLRLAPAQLEELELSWRRAHSAGSLAAAAVDAATPLLLQRNLRCAVLAVDVLSEAYKALAAATEAIELEEQMFDRLVDRGPDAALKPTRPTPAKLLPAVHGTWPMLLAALQDTGSVSLLEQQLSLLALLIQLAGGKFMARRFQRDAWPLLQRLLKVGPQAGAAALAASTAASTVGGGAAAAALLGVGAGSGRDNRDLLALKDGSGGLASAAGSGSSGSSVFGSALSSMQATAGARSSLNAALGGMVSAAAADEGGPLAPATLQRVQLAVLGCLTALASSSSAAAALQGPLVWDICLLAAPFLADSQALALREAAAKLLVAAAAVDADAVWLLLLDLGCCYEDICELLAPAAGNEAEELAQQQGRTTEAAAAGQAGTGVDQVSSSLPKLQQLLVPVGSVGMKAVGSRGSGDSAWCKLLGSSEGVSCGRRAAALLPRVAAAPVAWHSKAEQQLRVLDGAA